MGERNTRRYPFTESQWQELEHQALLFKYMASGTPIPHDLLLPIRSFHPESTSISAAQLFAHQPNIGWGCYQVGFGKKPEDPEPWRCRRTDGKKWRCSKEAYPDSKYCEKHMHRGKNRSRKHVEGAPAAAAASAAICSSSRATTTHNLPPYPYHLPMGAGTASSSADGDYCRSSWQLTPPAMSSMGERSCFTADAELHREDEGDKYRHCFVLGADLKLERPSKVEGEEQEARRPPGSFFNGWPSKSKDAWMDQEEETTGWGAFPRTQLSISIPMAHPEYYSPATGFHCPRGD